MNTAIALAHALHIDASAVALAWLVFRIEWMNRAVRADRRRTHKRLDALELRAGILAAAGTA